jgi:hypothetical protein
MNWKTLHSEWREGLWSICLGALRIFLT